MKIKLRMWCKLVVECVLCSMKLDVNVENTDHLLKDCKGVAGKGVTKRTEKSIIRRMACIGSVLEPDLSGCLKRKRSDNDVGGGDDVGGSSQRRLRQDLSTGGKLVVEALG